MHYKPWFTSYLSVLPVTRSFYCLPGNSWCSTNSKLPHLFLVNTSFVSDFYGLYVAEDALSMQVKRYKASQPKTAPR